MRCVSEQLFKELIAVFLKISVKKTKILKEKKKFWVERERYTNNRAPDLEDIIISVKITSLVQVFERGRIKLLIFLLLLLVLFVFKFNSMETKAKN